MRTEKKQDLAQRRHWRVRTKVSGTPERPRMSVKFTEKNIYVQFVDDRAGNTLAAVSTLSKALPDRTQLAANVTGATRIGKLAAEAARAKGIEQVVFDRGSARYHGKVKALADAAREAGLKF
jgi:large subunit ribosomal protein L18